MSKRNSISEDLVAPCGMNCAICSRYLAYVNNLKRSQCKGCRPENKRCTYLFGKCSGVNNPIKGNASAVFCFECEKYPCKEINRMDIRYLKNYHMSIKKNLEEIKRLGVVEFSKEQYKRYECKTCGGLISIHNGKCFKCETITRLVEKR